MNKEVLDNMVKIYKPNGYDWMGIPVTNKNPLGVYHVCDGEVSTIALISRSGARRLQILRTKNVDLYNEWVWLFYAINLSMTSPSLPYIEMQDELREQTNNEIYGINMNLKRSFK